MKDYWIPKFKYELVDWLSKRYPGEQHKFGNMNKKRLYAIYFSVRG